MFKLFFTLFLTKVNILNRTKSGDQIFKGNAHLTLSSDRQEKIELDI